MESYTLNTVLTIMAVLIFSEAKRDGNIPSSACEDMIPGHGGMPRTDSSFYEIQTRTYLFIPRKTLAVILTRQSTSPFKGFYCQAKDVHSNLTVGQFEDVNDMPDTRGHSCFSSSDEYDTISHSLQWSQNTAYTDTNTSIRWKTLDDSLESIKFRCTFVQSYSVFWINEESRILKSMATVSAEECCVMDRVALGCSPLCRHVSEEPADLDLARYTLESMWDSDAACSFFQALASIRCSYWSQNPNQNYTSEEDESYNESHLNSSLKSRSAEPRVKDDLEECCIARSISRECMIFCDPDHYAELTIDEQDFVHCLEESSELSLCIIYPAARDSQSSFSQATSPSSTNITSTKHIATSFGPLPFFPTTNSPSSTIHSATSFETSTSSLTTNSPPSSATTSTSHSTTSFRTSPLSSTTNPPPSSTTRSTSHSATSFGTSPLSPTTNPLPSSTTTSRAHSATSFGTSPLSPTTNPPPSSTTTYTSHSTTNFRTSPLSPTTSPPPSSTNISTTHGATSFGTSPISSSTTMLFQELEDGVVIYVITTTVNVEGALQDNSLQQSIFEGLENDFLTPSLATLAEFINVQVGVEVYEGSLIVVSEGYFLQQVDGSIPTIQNVENALQNRLSEVGGQIGHSGSTWLLDQTIAVRRKATNGLCVDDTCKSSQTCVEVGLNDIVCLCQGLNNEELICADENPTETTEVLDSHSPSSPSTSTSSQDQNADLPPGAIAGIAGGIVVLIIVVIILSVVVYRRTEFCRNSDRSDNLENAKQTSETYVYPNEVMENNEEHIYSSVSHHKGNEPPALPPDNLLPSNSVTYDLATSNQNPTKHGHSEEQPSTLTDNPAGAPEKNEQYAVPYALSDSAKTKQQKTQSVEDKDHAPVDTKKDVKILSDYSTGDDYELATDEQCVHENDSGATDIPLKNFKISSSEVHANECTTFDKE